MSEENEDLKARCIRDGEAIMRLAAIMDDDDFMTKDAIEVTAEALLRGVDLLSQLRGVDALAGEGEA